jgi:hypothetical protein
MDREDIIGYIMMLFVLLFCLKMYYESDAFNLKCIYSDVDGKKYCVRERAKLELAADLLATTAQKCEEIVKYMDKTYKDKENVKRLVAKYNPTTLKETLPTSELTAYSENKGEKLAFCLNKKKGGSELIDQNTLIFVAMHELSHIMTVSIGHTREFWLNFKFLLENAVKIGIYDPKDYKKKPQSYCGMTLSDNPYYDM